mgnify:CR=1 FL=1
MDDSYWSDYTTDSVLNICLSYLQCRIKEDYLQITYSNAIANPVSGRHSQTSILLYQTTAFALAKTGWFD